MSLVMELKRLGQSDKERAVGTIERLLRIGQVLAVATPNPIDDAVIAALLAILNQYKKMPAEHASAFFEVVMQAADSPEAATKLLAATKTV